MANKSSYLPYLDGLRALAVLLVVTAHMKNDVWHFLAGPLGVTIFFVISGYLITSLLLKEEHGTSGVSLAAFYTRRAFRIFPLYYVVLAIYCVLILGHSGFPEKRALFERALPYYLFYMQEVPRLSFHVDAGQGLPFYQSWSLGIEEKFYMVWPLICFVFLKSWKSMRLPCALLLTFGCALLGRYFSPYSEILLGCALALALDEPAVSAFAERYARPGTYVSLGVMFLGHIGFSMNVLPGGSNTYAILVTIFLGFLLSQATAIRSLLGIKPLADIGKLSYSIYLIHLLCLNAALRWTGKSVTLTYIATCALSIGISYVLHRTLERPLIQVGRRLAGSITTQRQAPTTEPALSPAD